MQDKRPNMPPPSKPTPPKARLLGDDFEEDEVIWPRTAREDTIFKQGVVHQLSAFNWHCAGIGFSVASLFWGACFHLWGG